MKVHTYRQLIVAKETNAVSLKCGGQAGILLLFFFFCQNIPFKTQCELSRGTETPSVSLQLLLTRHPGAAQLSFLICLWACG